jgi:hypothetical protein
MLGGSRASFDLVTPHLIDRLFEAEPTVLALLERDPFAGAPPRYLRWRVDYYEFTDAEERAKTGAWWKRRPVFESPILDREERAKGVGPE